MSITLVQSASQAFGFSASARAKAFASNLTAGNLVVVAVSTFGTGITVALTDTLGQTYVQIGAYVNNNQARISLWYVANCAAGANTVTVTPSGSANISVGLLEYSGVTGSTPLQASATSTGISTAPSPGAVTVPTVGDLVVAAFSADNAVTSIAATSPMTLRANLTGAGDSVTLGVSDDGSAPSPTETPAFTLGTSRNWSAIAASFETVPYFQVDFAHTLTWNNGGPFLEPRTADSVQWAGAFLVFGASTDISVTLSDSLAWSAFGNGPLPDPTIYHTLAWAGGSAGAFVTPDSYDRDTDTVYWHGGFSAEVGALATGRYRR